MTAFEALLAPHRGSLESRAAALLAAVRSHASESSAGVAGLDAKIGRAYV